ncbi:hypothetical protein [Fluviicola taffensis]|uniref:Uncharacterized protein n=1 Tax=Fluviicola taffensis (strain DSM 16823 / NCIMB 13979 / RW262) TaxID=755732 RepID=F2IH26_FLUTR|nr:hypothetical protein [Fluviicola taffensis]AEA45840.1 hypothetical protein Fluta_3874 [Fluviicola taffensis DSM 16823]
MGQEDYLRRQIDQLGQVLARMLSGLLGLKDKGLLNQGMEETDQALKAEFGFTTDEFVLLENEAFIQLLEQEKQFKEVHFEKLADLFLLLADNTVDSQKQTLLFEKCLKIYKRLEQSETTYSFDRHAKMEKINNMLKTLSGTE